MEKIAYVVIKYYYDDKKATHQDIMSELNYHIEHDAIDENSIELMGDIDPKNIGKI